MPNNSYRWLRTIFLGRNRSGRLIRIALTCKRACVGVCVYTYNVPSTLCEFREYINVLARVCIYIYIHSDGKYIYRDARKVSVYTTAEDSRRPPAADVSLETQSGRVVE